MDREKVITHLQIIHTWAEFARKRDLQFFTPKHLEDIAQWSDDAIALLIEQKAVVRCKDCKFYQKPEYGFTKGDCTYGSVWYQTEEDGFCSKAKVKD